MAEESVEVEASDEEEFLTSEPDMVVSDSQMSWLDWEISETQQGTFLVDPSNPRELMRWSDVGPLVLGSAQMLGGSAALEWALGRRGASPSPVSDEFAIVPKAPTFERMKDYVRELFVRRDREWGRVLQSDPTKLTFWLAVAGCGPLVSAKTTLNASIGLEAKGEFNLKVLGTGVTASRSYGVKLSKSSPVRRGKAVGVYVKLPYLRVLREWRPVSGVGEWFVHTSYEPVPVHRNARGKSVVTIDRGDRSDLSLDALWSRVRAGPSEIAFAEAGSTDSLAVLKKDTGVISTGYDGDAVAIGVSAELSVTSTGQLDVEATEPGVLWAYRPDDLTVVLSTVDDVAS